MKEMNIITKLKQENTNYLLDFAAVLTTNVDIFFLDYTRGETDFTHLLCLEKSDDLTFNKAMSILLMRLKMYNEEWTDFANYTTDDIERWISFLETEFTNTEHISEVSSETYQNDFMVKRMEDHRDLKSILYNGKKISFGKYTDLNPLLLDKIYHIERTQSERLETQYFIETELHFALFNWYTTA
jgi:hypothetical protein